MLEEAGVAATPGVDFDPVRGRNYLRLCYAGARGEMHEAVEQIGNWLRHQSGRTRRTMSDALFDILRKVTTATMTTMLLKKGIRRSWMNGPKPLASRGERIVGRAFTLRFIPVREDVATPESWGHAISTRAAIEEMPQGVIAVADAMGVSSAGIFGDILCARMKKRNVAALVTDGVVRDRAGVLMSGCRSGPQASRRRHRSTV